MEPDQPGWQTFGRRPRDGDAREEFGNKAANAVPMAAWRSRPPGLRPRGLGVRRTSIKAAEAPAGRSRAPGKGIQL